MTYFIQLDTEKHLSEERKERSSGAWNVKVKLEVMEEALVEFSQELRSEFPEIKIKSVFVSFFSMAVELPDETAKSLAEKVEKKFDCQLVPKKITAG